MNYADVCVSCNSLIVISRFQLTHVALGEISTWGLDSKEVLRYLQSPSLRPEASSQAKIE